MRLSLWLLLTCLTTHTLSRSFRTARVNPHEECRETTAGTCHGDTVIPEILHRHCDKRIHFQDISLQGSSGVFDECVVYSDPADADSRQSLEADPLIGLVTKETESLWPRGQVPYLFEDDFPENMKRVFLKAIEEIESLTSLSFSARKKEAQYVEFSSREPGCFTLGYTHVNVGSSCGQKGIIIHEILHTLGVMHEHQSKDRDRFISVQWENIRRQQYHNFDIIRGSKYRDYNVYDYGSIMHYHDSAFATFVGYKSIITKDRNYQNVIGQRKRMSSGDVLTVEHMYSFRAPFIYRVKNTAKKSLLVAARYMDLKGRWRWSPYNGVVYVSPGEELFLLSTANRRFYLYVTDAEGEVLTPNGLHCVPNEFFGDVCFQERRFNEGKGLYVDTF